MDQSWQHRPLPPNWEAKYDPSLGRYFYVNHATHSTQWKDPRIDFYANQQQTAQHIPMTVIVKPKCSTCRNVEVARAGQVCTPCTVKKQQQAIAARVAQEKKEAERKRRDEAERKRREEAARKQTSPPRTITPKKATEAEKRDVKRRLAQQFPNVSSLMIDMAIETTNCDFMKASSVLKLIAEDSPKPAKVKSSPKKKAAETKIKSSPKKKTSQPLSTFSANRGVSPSGVSFEVNFEVALSDTLSGSSVAGSSTTPPSTSESRSESRPVEPLHKTSPKKMKQADGRVKFAPVVRKIESKTFSSHLAVGPDAALVKGHDVNLLIDKYVMVSGPDAELRDGRNPAYVLGPNKNLTDNKENINAVGPSPSNLNGSQMLLYQGPLSMGTAI